MEVQAPFWLASPGAAAKVLVNNAAPQGFPFTFRLHGPHGSLLHSQEYFAESSANLTIPLAESLDGSAEAGYAVLE